MPARRTRTSASPAAGKGSRTSRASVSRVPSQRSARTRGSLAERAVELALGLGADRLRLVGGALRGVRGGVDAIGGRLGAACRVLGALVRAAHRARALVGARRERRDLLVGQRPLVALDLDRRATQDVGPREADLLAHVE